MTTALAMALVAGALAAVAPAGARTLRTWWRLRGTRVITCPESRRPAAVEIAAGRGAVAALAGTPALRLSACSRWPEMAGCGQACLAEIEAAPDGCLARAMLTGWYAGKRCAICGGAFDAIHWHDRKPALATPDRAIRDWAEVAAVDLPDVLATHLPVCWQCGMTTRFRRRFPDLVLDRPGA
jgi:hypothetical protein